MAEPGQTVGGSLATDEPNPYQETSHEEYSAAVAKSLPSDPTKPAAPSPVQTFWDKLRHGVNGKSRTVEMGRSVVRGVAEAGLEAGKTIGEAGAFVGRKTGVGEMIDPGFNDKFDKLGASGVVAQNAAPAQEAIDHYLGKRSDDPLASFTEATSQFLTGWAATGELKVLKGLGVAGGLVRGAVVDGTMFNPYEAQLAELAARAPVPVAKQLGALLSVKGDDGAVVARLKRAAAGIIPAAMVEGLVAASRVVRGGKALAEGATPEAVEAVSKDAQTVESVANGAQPAGQAVTVTPDGTLTHPEAGTVKMGDPIEAAQQAETMNAAVNARESAGKLEPEKADEAANFLDLYTNDPVAARGTEPPSLDISYHTSPDDAMKLANELSDRFATQVRTAVESQGEVHVEQSMQMALSGLGDVPRPVAHDVVSAGLSRLEGQSTWKMATDYVMKSYQDSINKLTDVVTARPHDPAAVEELRTATQNYFDLQDKFQAANSDAARALRLGQERPNLSGSDVRFKGEGEPVKPSNADGTAPIPGNASAMREQLKNATPEQLAALGRIFKMSGGEPRNAAAISAAAKMTMDGRPWRKVLEVFTNFLLSGPKTAQTIAVSGSMLNAFEPIVRMTAGAATLNGGLMREGADMLTGAFKYAGENIQTAWQALRAGNGVIDPAPQTIAIGGVTGRVVRTPGSVAGAAHELSKVTGYRSWVYAKSLREGRGIGLSGDALASYADNNLRAAFGPDGVAVVPDALKYGQLVSMASPLEEGSFSQGLTRFTNNALAAKFIIPFAKVSSNIFKYTFDGMPVLNMLAKRNRDIAMAGGEEAAILHTRTAYATTLATYAYLQAVQGNFTGRGPSNPQLRSMWLKDNQPYSLRWGKDSPWHSYQRFEPLAKTLGFMADYHTISSELGTQHNDAEQMLYAGVAATANNLASATYMKNLTEFGQTWGADDPEKVARFMQNMAGSIAVPQLATAFNSDPVYRDVQTMRDAIYNRLPGFSQTLDPRFNWAGEPILKTPGAWNRNVSISSTKDGTPTPVEQAMLEMQAKLGPFPKQLFEGKLDLTDREAFDNGTHKSPYARFNELLTNPSDGGTNLRDDMTEFVKSPEWKDMSAGADGFPGGQRLERVQLIKDRHEKQALRDLREEYPKLDDQIRAMARMGNAAKFGGENAVQEIEQETGTSRRPTTNPVMDKYSKLFK